MYMQLIWQSSLLFALAFLGGLATLARPWSDVHLHRFVSFGAGIFLGAVFIHLLPETMAGDGATGVGIMVLTGYLGIFFIERFLVSRKGNEGYDHNHLVVSLAAFIGMSVHELFDGLALAVTNTDSEKGWVTFVAILAHKLPSAVALASLFILAKMRPRRIVGFLLVFALMTPLGALLMAPFFSQSNGALTALLTGLVTGSFLYVATGDLLPEVFHTRDDRWVKLALLILGILLMALFGFAITEPGHEHTSRELIGLQCV